MMGRMNIMLNLLAIAAGGACGALARYGIAEAIQRSAGLPAYVGTALANLIGCFGIGLAWGMIEEAGQPPWVKALFVTGLLGAFTTFSTFSLDSMHLIHDRRFTELLGYVTVSVVIGLVAVKLGMAVAPTGAASVG